MNDEEITQIYGKARPPIAYSNFDGINISIAYDVDPIFDMRVEVILEALKDGYSKTYGENFYLINKEVREINGSDTGVLEFDVKQESEGLHIELAMGIINKTYFIVLFSCQIEEQSDFEEEFDKMINSIKVIK